MKTMLPLSLFIFLCTSTLVTGQDFNGIATYNTSRKIDLKMDSTQVNSGLQEQIAAQLRKQFQKEYTLDFTKHESVYKEVPKLDTPGRATAAGITIQVSGGSDILYKNLKEQRYANQNELFSKQFLIKDSLRIPEWELSKDTKNIGEYLCFKASYTRIDTIKTSVFSSEDSSKEQKDKVEVKERVITAWYTPQLPVSNGPDRFGGLPGLIMELNDGDLSILCSKIVLNPEGGATVDEPTKGKVVTQEEFDEIQQKKIEEMNEMNRSGRKGENRFEIRMGG